MLHQDYHTHKNQILKYKSYEYYISKNLFFSKIIMTYLRIKNQKQQQSLKRIIGLKNAEDCGSHKHLQMLANPSSVSYLDSLCKMFLM